MLKSLLKYITWVYSSVGERYVDIVEVAGSIPAIPKFLSKTILMGKKKIFFTGGGSAGHTVLALTIIEALKKKHPSCSVCYIGSRKGIEKKLVKEANVFYHAIFTGKYRRTFTLSHFSEFFFFLLGCFQCFFIFIRFFRKKGLVFSTGGFVSLPVVIMSSLLGYQVYLHEQTSYGGLANRMASFFVKKIFISFEASRKNFPPKKIFFSGYPIRKDFLKPLPKSLFFEGIDLKSFKKPILLFCGGGNGSILINQFVDSHLKKLCLNYIVLHQIGGNYLDQYWVKKSQTYFPFAYTSMLPLLIKVASLVISRSGAGMVSELIWCQKKVFFIPLKIAQKNEQYLNAKEALKHIPAKIISEDSLKIIDFLKEIKKILKQKQKQKQTKQIQNPLDFLVNEIASNVFK